MTLATQPATEVVQLEHHYPVSRERVFEAWTNPAALGKWFGPHSHRCHVDKFELRPGGRYQLRMTPLTEDQDCGGDSMEDSVCAGQFVEIQAPEKLVMTFSWIENGSDIGDTLLTVELFAAGSGTDLRLTHERLPDEQSRQAHSAGWKGSLECLEEFLQ